MDIEVFRKSVLSNYKITKQCRSVEPYGSGHINDTYKVVFGRDDKEDTYIFQRINTNIFKNPDQLMSNIIGVTEYLGKKIKDEYIHKSEANKKYREVEKEAKEIELEIKRLKQQLRKGGA